MDNPLYGKNFITITAFNRLELELVLHAAKQLRRFPQPQLLSQRVVASCFFEASTRTRLSFEAAVHRLGGAVVGFSDMQTTSYGQKGEDLQDTLTVISHYVDAIVIRHPQVGSIQQASKIEGIVPIINAGDGSHQHPTQTLVDLLTIQETQGRLEQLRITLVGDLKYGRATHSLVQALSLFHGNQLFLVSPVGLEMPPAILHSLAQSRVVYSQHRQLEEVISHSDILYMTRLQKERLSREEQATLGSYPMLSLHHLSRVPSHLKILHPLPRVEEIAREVDHTPHAYYFQQARNGLYVRGALLALTLQRDFSWVGPHTVSPPYYTS